MTDNNTKSAKLNTELSDQNNSIISDTLSNNIPDTKSDNISDPVDNTNDNTDQNTKPKRNYNPISKKNLISLSDRTIEERREIGRKGGIKSGEKRQERKTMRDTILEMLSETISDDMIEEYGLEKILKKPGGKSYQDAIIGAALLGAMNGDCKALQILRDTMGEMPTVRTENTTEIITKEDTDLMDNLKQSLIS